MRTRISRVASGPMQLRLRLLAVVFVVACGGGGKATVDGGGSSGGDGGGDDGGSSGGGDGGDGGMPDANTNVCTPACGTEMNANVACDVFETCESTCNDGFARCGADCTAETPTQCGAGCATCPTPAHGSATCSGGACGVACEPGFTACVDGLSYSCCAYASDVVAPQAFGGYTPSLAIDGAGHRHVLYYRSDAQQMIYASDASGGWKYEPVTPYWSSGGGAQYTLALGPRGPIVMYSYPNSSSALLFAERRAAGWSLSTLLDELPAGFAMVTDKAGRAHACFTSSSSHTGVRYALRSGDAWTITQVTDDPEARGACAIAVDPTTGLARIAYYKSDAKDIAYAADDASGHFTTGTVESTGDVGSALAIAVAPDGTPHVAAFRTDAKALRHLELHGTTWTGENIGASQWGYTPTIAVDQSGTPVVTYFSLDLYRVVVTQRAAGTWTPHTFEDVAHENGAIAVAPSGILHVATGDRNIVDHLRGANIGLWTDQPIEQPDAAAGPVTLLRASANGAPILVYTKQHDSGPAAVEVARRTGTTWAISQVPDAGSSPSAALDASGQLHVAYTTATGIGYSVEGAAGFGASEPLATGGSASDVSLALDGAGTAHAVYTSYVSPNYTLWHAVRGATSWSATMIDTGAHYQQPVLRIDGSNVLHVLWYDPTAKKTIYASSADSFAVKTTIEATAGAGHDLFVTAAGVPYACWTHTTGSGFPDLRYGSRPTTTWSSTLVPPPGSDVNSDVCAIASDGASTFAIARSVEYGAGIGALEITVLGTTNVSTLLHDDFYGHSLAIGYGAAGFEIGSLGQPYAGSGTVDRVLFSHK
jgi:hypothetical protein